MQKNFCFSATQKSGGIFGTWATQNKAMPENHAQTWSRHNRYALRHTHLKLICMFSGIGQTHARIGILLWNNSGYHSRRVPEYIICRFPGHPQCSGIGKLRKSCSFPRGASSNISIRFIPSYKLKGIPIARENSSFNYWKKKPNFWLIAFCLLSIVQ